MKSRLAHYFSIPSSYSCRIMALLNKRVTRISEEIEFDNRVHRANVNDFYYEGKSSFKNCNYNSLKGRKQNILIGDCYLHLNTVKSTINSDKLAKRSFVWPFLKMNENSKFLCLKSAVLTFAFFFFTNSKNDFFLLPGTKTKDLSNCVIKAKKLLAFKGLSKNGRKLSLN